MFRYNVLWNKTKRMGYSVTCILPNALRMKVAEKMTFKYNHHAKVSITTPSHKLPFIVVKHNIYTYTHAYRTACSTKCHHLH